MPCTSLTPAGAKEILNAYLAGDKIPSAEGIYFQPDYHCPDYTSTVLTWQNDVNNTTIQPKEFRLNIDMGKEVKETEFGQTKVGGGLDFSYTPWLSFNASGGSEHEEESFKTEDEASTIDITVTWNATKKVAINPGTW